MTDVTFTFRVDGDLKARFTDAARARDRTGAQLLRDFMRDYVDRQSRTEGYERWFERQVQLGIEQANSGQLVPTDEVEAEFRARRAATARRLSRTKS